MIKIAFVAAALLGAAPALADEVIIHRTDDVAPPPSSSSTTVEHRSSGDGCATKSVHSENDLGDSKTVTKTTCD